MPDIVNFQKIWIKMHYWLLLAKLIEHSYLQIYDLLNFITNASQTYQAKEFKSIIADKSAFFSQIWNGNKVLHKKRRKSSLQHKKWMEENISKDLKMHDVTFRKRKWDLGYPNFSFYNYRKCKSKWLWKLKHRCKRDLPNNCAVIQRTQFEISNIWEAHQNFSLSRILECIMLKTSSEK